MNNQSHFVIFYEDYIFKDFVVFVIKKIYCRIFQKIFKLALPLLPYREPDILENISDIPEIIIRNQCKKPIIVTDKGIVSLGLTNSLIEALNQGKIDFALYDKTVPNPTTDNVAEALDLYKNQNCDCIIAFGGGSSMDCAKALGACVAYPKKPLSKMKGILKVVRKIPLLIAIPTTAGTGSETTLAAVITDSNTRHKYAINSFPLIPRYAVLDAKVTLSLPKSITATTGMDALTHAVEAYIGGSTTKKTRKFALLATRLICKQIFTVYEDGNNLEARNDMLKAAYFAGCAFTRSYVGYVHAVAHSLGGAYNVPHGLANAILLPYVLEAYGKTAEKKLAKLAYHIHLVSEITPQEEAAKAFIQMINDMKTQLGIGNTVKEIKKEDISRLSKYADKEANPLYPVPKLMNAKELEKFYYQLMEK